MVYVIWNNGDVIFVNAHRNNDIELQVTLEDTKKASVLLIRKLFLLLQNLDALPNNVYLTMKLYYYDDSKTHYLWGVTESIRTFTALSKNLKKNF